MAVWQQVKFRGRGLGLQLRLFACFVDGTFRRYSSSMRLVALYKCYAIMPFNRCRYQDKMIDNKGTCALCMTVLPGTVSTAQCMGETRTWDLLIASPEL